MTLAHDTPIYFHSPTRCSRSRLITSYDYIYFIYIFLSYTLPIFLLFLFILSISQFIHLYLGFCSFFFLFTNTSRSHSSIFSRGSSSISIWVVAHSTFLLISLVHIKLWFFISQLFSHLILFPANDFCFFWGGSSVVRQHASHWLAIFSFHLCFLLVPLLLCVRLTARVQARLQGRALRKTRSEWEKHWGGEFSLLFSAVVFSTWISSSFSFCFLRGFGRSPLLIISFCFCSQLLLLSRSYCHPSHHLTSLQLSSRSSLNNTVLWDWPCLFFDSFSSSFSSLFFVVFCLFDFARVHVNKVGPSNST